MLVLGISCFYHDAAAVILRDGEIVGAAQEERFTRIKHYPGFPEQAILWCLARAGVTLSQVDRVVFYDKPFLKFERLLETYIAFAPRGLGSFIKSMPIWLKEKLFQKDLLVRKFLEIDSRFDYKSQLCFSDHHLSHAASAYYPSPFEDAVILTMDGVGEWATTSVMLGERENIAPQKEIHFPHSLGLLYSAFTYFCGFKVNSGEYKLMGLAPYGSPIYEDTIRDNLITLHADGSFSLNQEYFNYCTGLRMTNRKFGKLFGKDARNPEAELTQDYMDIASSIQVVVEDVILNIARNLRKEYQSSNLCLAGGVALNCVANGRLIRSGIFDNIWIQPASGDAGGALGAAMAIYHMEHGAGRKNNNKDAMQGAYLGPEFSDMEIRTILDELGASYRELNDDDLYRNAADALMNNEVLGWFQGSAEFGPRALGNRSIIGNPLSPDTQKTMNLKIKYRESFRPFAPAVLEESVSDYFELRGVSPYMLVVADVEKKYRLDTDTSRVKGFAKLNDARSVFPAITHVDQSARIQTVNKLDNKRFYKLISSFKKRSGYGLVVNTSFNIRGEPIVHSPADAFRCFMGTGMDRLYIGNFELVKMQQNNDLIRDYRDSFALD